MDASTEFARSYIFWMFRLPVVVEHVIHHRFVALLGPSRRSRKPTLTFHSLFQTYKRIQNLPLIYIRFRTRVIIDHGDHTSFCRWSIRILACIYQPCVLSFGVLDIHIVRPLYSSLSMCFLDTCP